MDQFDQQHSDFGFGLSERLASSWAAGMKAVKRAALAFALSTVVAIGLGAAVTDSALVQILVTLLAAIALWLPMLLATIAAGRMLERRRERRFARPEMEPAAVPGPHAASWSRLLAVAPADRDRLRAMQRSLERSRNSLGAAQLDPDAHDLCVLIDRRLPELIDHQLESLAPDDRSRRKQIGALVDLVEDFARHCSGKRADDGGDAQRQAEILRRRFEMRLAGDREL